MKKAFLIIVAVSIIIFSIWLVGMVMFARDIVYEPPKNIQKTDAIIVLTGGRQRIKTALELYDGGNADYLFISGVPNEVTLTSIIEQTDVKEVKNPDNIILGHHANNTAENALETASWVYDHKFKSIRLVTSAYHMPRSLIEFRCRNIDSEIIPHPVFTDEVKHNKWWKWPGTTLLLSSEYNKYLFALAKYTLSCS